MHLNCLMCFQLITVGLDVLQHKNPSAETTSFKAEGEEKPIPTKKQRLNLTKKESILR